MVKASKLPLKEKQIAKGNHERVLKLFLHECLFYLFDFFIYIFQISF